MRTREIKPGFWKNEDLPTLPFEARLLFIGLWNLADREGRLEDRPRRIKIALFPLDNLDIDSLLEKLAEQGFITRYEVDGRRVIQVLTFKRHQKIHPNEAHSVLPEQLTRNRDITRQAVTLHDEDAPRCDSAVKLRDSDPVISCLSSPSYLSEPSSPSALSGADAPGGGVPTIDKTLWADEGWQEFKRIAKEREVLPGGVKEWDIWAPAAWKALDFEKRAAALADIKIRDPDSPEMRSFPNNYLTGKKWTRPHPRPKQQRSAQEERLRNA